MAQRLLGALATHSTEQISLDQLSGVPVYARGLDLINRFNPSNSSYNSDSGSWRKTRQACGRVSSGAGSMHIVNSGDSSGIGYNGTIFVSANAFPRQCGMALAQMLGVRFAQGVVPANVGAAVSDQWTLSGSASAAVAGVSQLVQMTAAGFVKFSPDVPGDSIQIFYSDLSGAATYQIDGGTPVSITTTGTSTMKVITVPGLTDGLHTVQINWVSGTFYVGGARLYPSAVALHFHNMCVGGSYANWGTTPSNASKNWSDVSSNGLGTVFKAMITLTGVTVDLHMTSVGNNDHAQAVAPATIVTGINNLRAFWPSADFLDVHAWMVNGANTTTFDTLCGLIYQAADAGDWAHVDWNDVVGGAATALANGALGADNNHPIDATSIFFGRMLAQVIGSGLDATGSPLETYQYSDPGTAVLTGVYRLYNITGRKLSIRNVRASLGTAPTGATYIVDVKKNGTTIFTGGTGRPTIAVSTNTATSGPPAVTSWLPEEYLTVDIVQVGSTVTGAALSVQITAA